MKLTSELNDLIEELIQNPLSFPDDKFQQIIDNKHFTNRHLAYIFRKIYDLNEGSILNKSNAASGLLGFLNTRSRNKRNKKFFKKIKKGFRCESSNKVILAEGDSWFEYPLFIREIVDNLIKLRSSDYAVYSLAFGGDWLANMIYENQYIEELQLLSPDAFLISGGGNDLAGGKRIAKMVEKPSDKREDNLEFYACRHDQISNHDTNSKVNFDKEKFTIGVEYLNKEFYGLLNAFKLQYKLLFQNLRINTSKFKNLKIITQGYDYPIPSYKLGFGLNPLKMHKPITNYFFKNGHWLKLPLQIKGIKEQEVQNAILYAMIFEFNEMMIDVISDYENIHHIDCRGLNTEASWYNELHPESYIFKRIAKAYQMCLDGKITEKHIIVKNIKDDV